MSCWVSFSCRVPSLPGKAVARLAVSASYSVASAVLRAGRMTFRVRVYS